MANPLDEETGPINAAGRDVHVIDKKLPVTIGSEAIIFEILVWILGFFPGLICSAFLPPQQSLMILAAGILPGIIYLFMKVSAAAQLQQLEQRIQANASQIDAYLEQRVIILQNLVGLLAQSIELDKDVMKSVAAYRRGMSFSSEAERNSQAQKIDQLFSRVGMSFEAYPELKSQQMILEAMRQNSYLQQEITAARTLYNDAILLWNRTIFQWPVMKIVAARASYTTRIPFIASGEMKAKARDKFF